MSIEVKLISLDWQKCFLFGLSDSAHLQGDVDKCHSISTVALKNASDFVGFVYVVNKLWSALYFC